MREETSSFETRYAFGGSLDLDVLGIEIEDTTLIPGLAVASSRAKPLAGIVFSHSSLSGIQHSQSKLV